MRSKTLSARAADSAARLRGAIQHGLLPRHGATSARLETRRFRRRECKQTASAGIDAPRAPYAWRDVAGGEVERWFAARRKIANPRRSSRLGRGDREVSHFDSGNYRWSEQ